MVAQINHPHRSSGAGVVDGLHVPRDRRARFVRLDHLTPADVRYG